MRPRQDQGIPTPSDSEKLSWTSRVGDYLVIPLTLALTPMFGAIAGWFLDRKFGTFPILTLVLLVLGFVGGAREVWRSAKRSQSETKRS